MAKISNSRLRPFWVLVVRPFTYSVENPPRFRHNFPSLNITRGTNYVHPATMGGTAAGWFNEGCYIWRVWFFFLLVAGCEDAWHVGSCLRACRVRTAPRRWLLRGRRDRRPIARSSVPWKTNSFSDKGAHPPRGRAL